METYLVALVFLLVAFLLMAVSLHFSRYKMRGRGCGCQGSTGRQRDARKGSSCASCPTTTDTSHSTP